MASGAALSGSAWAQAVPMPPQSLPGAAQALPSGDGSPSFPDRSPKGPEARPPTPGVQLGDLSLNASEASYRRNASNERLHLRLGYGSSIGGGLGFDYARILDDRWAWGLNAAVGPEQVDVVVNGLYSLAKPWYLGVSAGYLRRTDTYPFYSGPDKATVDQGSWRANLQREFEGGGVLTDAGVQLYGAQAHAPGNNEKVMLQETATELVFMVDPRRIAPGRLSGMGLSVGLQATAYTRLKLGIGRESVRYPYQDGTGFRDARTSASADLQQRLSGCWRLDAGVSTGVAGERYRVALARGPWSVGLARQIGRDSTPDQTQLTLGVNLPLGGRVARACGGAATTPARGIDRLDEVFRRPVQLPTTVLARVDPTARPYALATINKSALNGGQVSATPDALLIQLPGGPALAVFALSVNGAPVGPNATGLNGERLVSVMPDGRVRIEVRAFPNPGAGVSQTVEAVVVQASQVSVVTFNVVGQ